MKAIVEYVLKPLLRRSGTALAAFLVFGGDWACARLSACGLVSPEGASLVATWVVASALVCVDLVAGWYEQRRLRAGR